MNPLRQIEKSKADELSEEQKAANELYKKYLDYLTVEELKSKIWLGQIENSDELFKECNINNAFEKIFFMIVTDAKYINRYEEHLYFGYEFMTFDEYIKSEKKRNIELSKEEIKYKKEREEIIKKYSYKPDLSKYITLESLSKIKREGLHTTKNHRDICIEASRKAKEYEAKINQI